MKIITRLSCQAKPRKQRKQLMQSRIKSQQCGFSLIEVMISSLLGIFLIAGALSLYSSNKDSYRIQQAVSGTLKNSRFIINRLERKISSAGYSGFYSGYINGTENNLNTPASPLWNIEIPVFGHNNVDSSSTIAGVTGIRDGTDVLILKSMTNESNLTTQASSSSFTIDAASGYSTGNIVIATDIEKASIFQIDSADSATVVGETTVTLSVGTSAPAPGNATLPTNLFDNTATIGTLETLVYFLRTGTNGNTALFEGRLTTSSDQAAVTTAIEIIPNVENIQYIYGIDTDGNGSIDKYSDASTVSTAEWDQVHTIGISLLLFSENNNITINNNSYSFDSTHFTFTKDTTASDSADKRQRQVFTTYVTLKNL
ncbi:MAG: PilW family protein [Thiotrichaceae bacterium]